MGKYPNGSRKCPNGHQLSQNAKVCYEISMQVVFVALSPIFIVKRSVKV